LYASTSPAVTWGGFGSKGARFSATNCPALKLDCSSIVSGRLWVE
jgi:hypothetical protein